MLRLGGRASGDTAAHAELDSEREAVQVQDKSIELSIRRPFNWGVVVVGDSAAASATDLRDHAGMRISRYEAWIPVRHAQDVDMPDDLADDEPIPPFEVTITCQIASSHPARRRSTS